MNPVLGGISAKTLERSSISFAMRSPIELEFETDRVGTSTIKLNILDNSDRTRFA